MEEVVGLLRDILSELQELNGKIDDLKGWGTYNNISDICSKITDASDEICGKIDSLQGGIYDINDIYRKVDEINDHLD